MNREILRGVMSQENVELVRRGLDLVNRGDIEGALELLGGIGTAAAPRVRALVTDNARLLSG